MYSPQRHFGLLFIVFSIFSANDGHTTESSVDESSLKVSGGKNISLTYQDFRGESNLTRRFNGLQRQESTRLSVEGNLQNKIKFKGSFLATDNPLSEDKILAQFFTDHLELTLGDLNTSFEGSQFSLLNRQLFGAQLKGHYDKFDFTLVASRPKGQQKYVKSYGNDSQGPFDLNERIVENSENVTVNNNSQIRGKDYQIDYLNGEIRFLNKIIEDTDLIEIEYEALEVGSTRRLYGGRFVHHPTKQLSYGLTLVDDRDQTDAVSTGIGRLPSSLTTGSLDATIRPISGWSVNGEIGGSIFDPNLSGDAAKVSGLAYRGGSQFKAGPFQLNGSYIRVEPKFTNSGNSTLRQDMRARKAKLGFKPTIPIAANLSYEEKDYVNAGFQENILSTSGQAAWTPKTHPHLDYILSRRDERDTLAGDTNPFQVFRETSHRGKISKSFSHLGVSLTGEETERKDFPGLAPNELSRAGRLSLGLKNVKIISVTGSAELRRNLGTNQGILVYRDWVQSYDLNLRFKPIKNAQLTTKGIYRQDSRQGWQARAQGSYRIKPNKALSSQGSYRLEFLKQSIGSNQEKTLAHTASFKLRVAPWSFLSMDYRNSFRVERFKDRDQDFSQNQKNTFIVKGSPTKILSLTGLYSQDKFWILYPGDPTLPTQINQTNRVWGTDASLTPKGKVSITGGYQQTILRETALDFTKLPALVNKDRNGKIHNASTGMRYKFNKRINATAGYTFSETRQEVPGAQSAANPVYPYGTETFLTSPSQDNIWTRQHGGNLNVSIGLNKWLSASAGAGYDRTADLLAVGQNKTHTSHGSVGLSARTKGGLNLSTKYTISKSAGQVHTQRQAWDMNLGMNLSKDMTWTTTASYTTQRFPSLSTTAARSNLSIRF